MGRRQSQYGNFYGEAPKRSHFMRNALIVGAALLIARESGVFGSDNANELVQAGTNPVTLTADAPRAPGPVAVPKKAPVVKPPVKAVPKEMWHLPTKYPSKIGYCFNQRVGGRYHAGVDFNSIRPGNIALAAHDGVVVEVGRDPNAGKYVMIETLKAPSKLNYTYEHLGKITVHEGQVVDGGKTAIGTPGRTGSVYGADTVNGEVHVSVSAERTMGSYSGKPHANMVDFMSLLPNSVSRGKNCT